MQATSARYAAGLKYDKKTKEIFVLAWPLPYDLTKPNIELGPYSLEDPALLLALARDCAPYDGLENEVHKALAVFIAKIGGQPPASGRNPANIH